MLMHNLSVSHAGTQCQKLQDEGRVHINRKWGLLEVASTFQMMENLKQKQQFFFWLYSCQFAQHTDSTCHIPCGAVSLTDFLLSFPTDARGGYCYASLLNGRCANQNSQLLTKMQCCCDSGRCWSDGSTPEMCPIRGTGAVIHMA